MGGVRGGYGPLPAAPRHRSVCPQPGELRKVRALPVRTSVPSSLALRLPHLFPDPPAGSPAPPPHSNSTLRRGHASHALAPGSPSRALRVPSSPTARSLSTLCASPAHFPRPRAPTPRGHAHSRHPSRAGPRFPRCCGADSAGTEASPWEPGGGTLRAISPGTVGSDTLINNSLKGM